MDGEWDVALRQLGYSREWLEWGILDVPTLLAQTQQWAAGGDSHSEHYRYATLQCYVAHNTQLETGQLARLLQVLQQDGDGHMAAAVLQTMLVKWAGVSEVQFQMLAEALRGFGDWAEPVVLRHGLLRQLHGGVSPVDGALFQRCLAAGDSVVSAALLAYCDVGQLQQLLAQQPVKRIRHLATQRLRQLQDHHGGCC